ncbi:MAG TPA: MXAN_6640 family putative metalloprotease, partial [candidate division Zixibacteria bacterium]|nr:MXAN_6640 family putative metalloprotease [candidate division Zixibacteria bacterium]
MKRVILTAALLFLFTASVFAITTQQEQLIVDNALAVLGQTKLELPDTLPVKRICGTATLMEAKQRFNELSPQAQAALSPVLFPRPVLQKSYDPASGRFRIHYDTAGAGAVRYASTRNAQGVPVWVDTLGMVLDSIWDKEITQMGFRTPVSDGFYTPNGGDGRFDVYLDELGGVILGYTAPDSAGGVLGNRATAFMVLDNDYIGIPGYTTETEQRQVLRVTAAHEFFHAIQFAYTVFGAEVVGGEVKAYWYEASAVWMEEQMYNEINDYIQYLPFWFDAPQLSFRSFSQNFGGDPYRAYRPYALGIYGLYLSKRFSNPSYGYPVVRRVWERMATVTGFNLFAALDYALGTEGSNFLASLQEFYRWNYFVGSKVPLNPSDTLYGSEAAAWPTFDQYRRVDSTTSYPTQFPPVTLSCNSCHPNVIKFFCAPCSVNTVGFPCSTKCQPSCLYIPYQLSLSAFCVNDIEDLGASYLNFQNPGTGPYLNFALNSDTARSAPWFTAVGGYHNPSRSYTHLATANTLSNGRVDDLFFANFGLYTELVVLVMNSELLPAGAARQNSAYAHFASVENSATRPFIAPSDTVLSFSAVEGGANPPPLDMLVLNNGGGTLAWFARKLTSAGWLTFNPKMGASTSTITFFVNVSGLTANLYSDTILLEGNAANAPRMIIVHLNVASPNDSLIQVSKNLLVFNATFEEGPLPSQTFRIFNGGVGTLNWSASINPQPIWLSAAPLSGTDSGTVLVSVDSDSLPVGVYTATVLVSANASNSPRSVQVRLNIF